MINISSFQVWNTQLQRDLKGQDNGRWIEYIPNDDTQNYPFCRLQYVVETFGHSTKWTNQSNSMKVPKVVEPTNKKRYYKFFGTCVINSPMSPPSLWLNSKCLYLNSCKKK